jgi:hypothetical protein
LDTYETMFKSQFLNIGFNNRLFVVIGNGSSKHAIPKLIPDVERRPLQDRLQKVLGFVKDLVHTGCFALPIDPQAEAIFEQWYHTTQGSIFSKRLDTYGHRLMVLLAANAMQDRVTSEVADQTVTLLRYQLAARQQADPIQADTQVARIEEKIRRLVGAGGISKRSLEQLGHKTRAGSYLWNIAVKNLEKDGEIYFNAKTSTYYRCSP